MDERTRILPKQYICHSNSTMGATSGSVHPSVSGFESDTYEQRKKKGTMCKDLGMGAP
jgi:hypothetical protein